MLQIRTTLKYIWDRTSDAAKRGDMLLLGLCCVCTIFGIVLIHSAVAAMPRNSTYVPVQIFAFMIGLFLYYVFTVIDIDIIADRWILLLAFETFIMLLLIPFGVSGDTGNNGWLRFMGIGLQPSEVAKVVFIILMAKHMTYLKEYKDINSIFCILQLVIHFGYTFVLLMVTSDDLGSAVVFAAIFLVMMIMAGIKYYWFLIGGGAVAIVIPFLWNFLDDYQKNRILAPYDPTIDPDGWGVTWQTTRSKLALTAGQFTGVGYGKGPQTQTNALTGKQTDFIFAVAGEELGMLACLVIMLLLSAIIIRCMWVGVHSNNTMSMLVCSGVAASMFFQMLVNTGMCIGITPVIGITLPFFSYGGSSLMSSFAAVGLVSGAKYRPTPQQFHRY